MRRSYAVMAHLYSNGSRHRRYLLIVQKPYSEDYCRGCHMASYSDYFEMYNYLSASELTDKMVKYLVKNKDLGINEAEYELHVFTEGVKLYPSCDMCDLICVEGLTNHMHMTSEEFDKLEILEKKQQELEEEFGQLLSKVTTLVDEKIEADKKKALAEKQIQAELEAKRLLALKEEQYKKLKKELGHE